MTYEYLIRFDGLPARKLKAKSHEQAAIRAYWLAQHLLGPASSFDVSVMSIEGPESANDVRFKLTVKIEMERER